MICHHCATRIAVNEASFCPRCGTRINDRHTTGIPVAPHPFPWDTVLHDGQPLRLLAATVTEALFHPSRFYRQAVNHSERLLPALLYALITGGMGLTAAWVWSRWLPVGAAASPINLLFSNQGAISPSTLTATPLLLLLQLLFTSCYIVIILRLSRLKQCSFNRLLRLLCFTETPMLLQTIPVVGSFLSTVLWIYSLLTMLRFLCEGSRVRIILLLVLPVLLISSLFVIILFAGLIGGIIAGTGILPDWKSVLDFR